MGNSLTIQILDSSNKTLKQRSADFGFESTFLSKMFEEFSSLGVFQSQDWSIFNWLACHFNFSIFFAIDHIDQVFEIESLQELVLPPEGFSLA
jgi:hypothetical protein